MADQADFKSILAYDETFRCVQCGYCLPACPTYQTMGKETHSPRGRINLVKAAAEGRLSHVNLLAESIDKCLGCRACETACPVGVNYGKIFESAKELLEEQREDSPLAKRMRKWLFQYVFPNKRLLNGFGHLLWLYQKTGLQMLLRKSGLKRLLPYHLGEFEAVIPPVSSPIQRIKRSKKWISQQKKYRVAFFTGCVMDVMFERINRLSMELLQRTGCDVFLISGATCCGAIHAHAGEKGWAKQLAKRNIDAFEQLNRETPVDFIVNSIGGCGAMLKEYHHLFQDEPEWQQRALAFAEKNRDISEVLVLAGPLPFRDQPAEKQVVTYQRSCHMTNVQRVINPPLELLRSVPGIELREMESREMCCGSAGIYNIVQYEESMKILDEKMEKVKDTGAKTIVTTNPGCHLQLELGVQREGLKGSIRVVHLVELLADACGIK